MFGYTYHHVTVFVLTFISYAFLHDARKAFSNVKTSLEMEWTPTFFNGSIPVVYPNSIWNDRKLFSQEYVAKDFLGALDFVFLISYAIGLYICGILGDTFNPRIILSFGMMLAAISIFFFGSFTEYIHLYNIYFYGIVWALNGLIQSSGWPNAVAIMGNWFDDSNQKGLIFGIWSSCASAGNILAGFLVPAVILYGYDYGLLVPTCVLFSGGVIMLFGLLSSPDELKTVKRRFSAEGADQETTRGLLDGNESDEIDDVEAEEIPEVLVETEPINFFSAFLLPGVIPYSLAYACLKCVNYAFFFWLPFYLHSKYGWSNKKSDELGVYYDVGGIVGSIITGIISDRMWARSPVVVLCLVLSLPSLFIYSNSPGVVWENSLIMAVTGFLINGPANIISSAISADLGKQDCISGNQQALATVTGIIDGTGSIGAAIGQGLIPVIQNAFGWEIVFYCFMLMIALTVVCILPIFIRDVKWKINQIRSRRNADN